FDEYLIFETRYKKYEPGEVIAFLDILQTIARNKRKFRCFMIANEINPVNPYFAFFKIEGFHRTDILIGSKRVNRLWSGFKILMSGWRIICSLLSTTSLKELTTMTT